MGVIEIKNASDFEDFKNRYVAILNHQHTPNNIDFEIDFSHNNTKAKNWLIKSGFDLRVKKSNTSSLSDEHLDYLDRVPWELFVTFSNDERLNNLRKIKHFDLKPTKKKVQAWIGELFRNGKMRGSLFNKLTELDCFLDILGILKKLNNEVVDELYKRNAPLTTRLVLSALLVRNGNKNKGVEEALVEYVAKGFLSWWKNLSHSEKLSNTNTVRFRRMNVPEEFGLNGQGNMRHFPKKAHKQFLISGNDQYSKYQPVMFVTICEELLTPRNETIAHFQKKADDYGSVGFVIAAHGDHFKDARYWVVPRSKKTIYRAAFDIMRDLQKKKTLRPGETVMGKLRKLSKIVNNGAVDQRKAAVRLWTGGITGNGSHVRPIQNATAKLGRPNLITSLATRRPNIKVTNKAEIDKYIKWATELRTCIRREYVTRQKNGEPPTRMWRGGVIDQEQVVNQIDKSRGGCFQTVNPLSFSTDVKIAESFSKKLEIDSDRSIHSRRYVLEIDTNAFCDIETSMGSSIPIEKEKLVSPGIFRITTVTLKNVGNMVRVYHIRATFTPDNNTYTRGDRLPNPMKSQSVMNRICPILYDFTFPPSAKRKRRSSSTNAEFTFPPSAKKKRRSSTKALTKP